MTDEPHKGNQQRLPDQPDHRKSGRREFLTDRTIESSMAVKLSIVVVVVVDGHLF